MLCTGVVYGCCILVLCTGVVYWCCVLVLQVLSFDVAEAERVSKTFQFIGYFLDVILGLKGLVSSVIQL